jgi:hypothetical protein
MSSPERFLGDLLVLFTVRRFSAFVFLSTKTGIIPLGSENKKVYVSSYNRARIGFSSAFAMAGDIS